MLDITILALEVLVLLLVTYVAAKSYVLAQREASEVAASNNYFSPLDDDVIVVDQSEEKDTYNNRIETLKEAQIFSGIQMIPVKREFKDLHEPQLAWLREAIGYYLLGSSDYIGKQAGCDLKTRSKYNDLVLMANLKLSGAELKHIKEQATNRDLESDENLMIIAGAKAAKEWTETQKVSDSLKLRSRLNYWGVFA